MNHIANAFEAVLPTLFSSEDEIDALIDLGIRDLDAFRADVSGSRVITRLPEPPKTEPKGNLRTRVYSLADDTTLYDSQSAYREAIVNHPAYRPVLEELRGREHLGMLWDAMDTLEEMGVIVSYDKGKKVLTLGFQLSRMRQGFQEVIPLRDIRNSRTIEWVNTLKSERYITSDGFVGRRETKMVPDDIESVVPASPVYYLTFELGTDL